ncbi:MAG: HD domain-containing protein, partial [Halobacteriales archaeon]
MGVEIRESPVDDEAFDRMKAFVSEYLTASVENEDAGGRMRWYPWHSADYRFNHSLNVVELATEIAEREGADVDVVRVAALFHDVAKLEADQDAHAAEGARVAREYLESHGEFPESFVDRVCDVVESHSYTGDV